MSSIDFSLYLVTDRALLPRGLTYVESLEEALIGGVTVVQLREKTADTSEFLTIARETKALCQRYRVPLIINDRIDIALAVEADGVHLGQTDMPIDIARKLLPQGTIIGISCNTLEEVRRARESGADYVGLGAVWDTQTKKLTNRPIGVRNIGVLLDALDGSDLKAVAIGGIKSSNLARLMSGSVSESGRSLDGVAVVSDIVASAAPKAAAQALKAIFRGCREATGLSPAFSGDLLARSSEIMEKISSQKPLVHQITNTVVATQSANMTLAVGASPIMATAAEEMADLAKLSNALLVNIGTLVGSTFQGMLKAGVCANAAKIPVVFDPVGVGATSFRKSSVNQLLDVWHPTVIKGNAGELAVLAGSSEAGSKGVDTAGSFQDPVGFVKKLSRKERCIVVLTGETDYVSDGTRVAKIHNGDPLLGQITGSGCMLGSLIAVCCATENMLAHELHSAALTRDGDFFTAAVAAVLILTVAAELAVQQDTVHGSGTFLAALIDQVASLRAEDITRLAKIEIVQPS